MTTEQLITRFVYQHGEISLQGIGTIHLTDAVPDTEYLQKHRDVAISGISFQHIPTAHTTPAFIKYYAEQRGKIASLAENDIEAFLNMAVQFLNIGNPFELKGLGTLSKQKDGKFIMSPGFFVATREEEAANRFRERQPEKEDANGEANFYGTREQKSSPVSKAIIAVLVLVVLGIGGWWLYSSFIKSGQTDAAANTADTLVVPQATTVVPATQDTTAFVPAAPDSTTVRQWKTIVRQGSNKEEALAFWKIYQRKRPNVILETADSVNFTFYLLLECAAKDTAAKADSLRKIFTGPVKVGALQ